MRPQTTNYEAIRREKCTPISLPQLCRTAGCRLGNALKRFYYNAMRYYLTEVDPADDLLKRSDKDFEVKRWLE